jgi:FkbM family methyltransferase
MTVKNAPWGNTFLLQCKRFARRLAGRDLGFYPSIRVASEFLGSEYGGWAVCTRFLNADSVIYSVGIGEDVSFDLALIQKLRCDVHAFDPTPKSLAWLAKQNLPSQLHIYPLGLADFDGKSYFAPPKNENHVSHTLIQASVETKAIEVEMRTLTSLMQELGHQTLDLLKMDIEGAEYDVIRFICHEAIPIKQILVEFHHGIYPNLALKHTKQAIESLLEKGYKIFAISPTGREYHFIAPHLL